MTRRIHDLLDAIRVGFCKLNEIQFRAPWNPDRRAC